LEAAIEAWFLNPFFWPSRVIRVEDIGGKMSGIAKLDFLARVVACASMVGLGTFGHALAQTPAIPKDSSALWSRDVTAVTVAPGGAWGVATEQTAGLAIAKAVANCRTMSATDLGCGSRIETIRGGWILALRCGAHSILAADESLAEAKKIAVNRETELRRLYVPDMPQCVRVLAVDPSGAIVPLGFAYSDQ
jgi:hypothetical protein